MSLHLDTITETMRGVAQTMHDVLGDGWYLVGGTALALQIGHRASVDLDYFSLQSFDVDSLQRVIAGAFGDEVTFDFEAPQTLWCTIRGVKVSCITRQNQLLKPCVREEYFVLAHVSDIVVMKLLALCSREEYKDYIDLACLSRETDVRQWPEWWRTVYPHQDLTSWLMALSTVANVSVIPLVVQPTYAMPPLVPTIRNVVTEITAFLEKTVG